MTTLTAFVSLTFAVPAVAQITTGIVVGSVKDAQAGVVPGATLVLINEAQGTKSTPIVSSSTGDFVFPNIASGTYTLEVTMSGFKTLTRAGIVVGAGNRVDVG